jgi:diguanylate cyclase (GGDEF)-like protein
MHDLVESLANLSSLRDREALDFALVTLLRQIVPGTLQAVRLLRRVGEHGDQRWQTCASLLQGEDQPTRDRVWVDFNTLPHVEDYPDRHMCALSGQMERLLASPSLTFFPLGLPGHVESILEIQTPGGLEEASEKLVASLLKIYRNVQGLLDYGEKDSLTELLNRKTFDGAFIKATLHESRTRDLAQPDRRVVQSGSYWLAVLDIDHFKRVNDSFGHLIGDEVLVLIARLMRASFRLSDQLYRFGGEEFVVLTRCANAEDAHGLLQRFRLLVQAHEFPRAGHITVSIGCAPLMADDTPGAGFDRADKAVYYAKGHGRNQVCSYPELVAAGELAEVTADQHAADFF